MDKVSRQWIYLMYFNVILSKMSKEIPKIQSNLTDLEKVGWNRLDHRLSFVSLEAYGMYFSIFVTLFPYFLQLYSCLWWNLSEYSYLLYFKCDLLTLASNLA